ncbi:MAG: hypothetical protein ACXAB2_06305 [Candidatus Hodarchaeales archaeon]|jgi:predicted  nucleic acid-binding Zn-ribbon protein
MSELEIYAKKIETLTKVARLLGDQIQAQNKVINKLQSDIVNINNTLTKLTKGKDLELPDLEKIIDTQEPEKIQLDRKEEEIENVVPEKKSEKDELIQALKIVDEL